MGLPIFGLILALLFHTLLDNYKTLQASFYIEAVLLLVFSIYFILYLIYNGFDVKIIDDVSKTFTREYLFNYIKGKLKKEKEYTLILISIDNLDDINSLYGMKNGDKVLAETANWVAEYLSTQKIDNFPLGHIKGGDFIIGLEGLKNEYSTLLELMCLKSNEFRVDDIEVKLSGAISDTNYSRELDYIVENLFELQEHRKELKKEIQPNTMKPNELEFFVIDAINKRSLNIMTQDIFQDDSVVFKECFVKLKSANGKLLYPKNYTKVINKLGLTIEYDLMVLQEIILQVSDEPEVMYALGISPTSLRNNKFLSATKELLKNSNKKIMFILCEHEYFSHTKKYNSIIKTLKDIGIRIAIDKLGSYHTSFLYLKELDIDLVRFDTQYSSYEKMHKYSAIVNGFRLMAKEKKIKCWIKNIQTQEAYNLANEFKVEYLQGKYLSQLLPINESEL
ncbi:EAL domain-containing protein [Sulfurimonas sp. SAG-AH-194-L11]|nr:EAL domain-containing protein [Sulfurimonas sp. SAG-AH-194-L11]